MKKAFLLSLKELLKVKKPEERDKNGPYYEIIRRIFGNTKSIHNYPNLGKELDTVEYLIKISDGPFEELELWGLRIMKHLIKWDWGMRS